MFLLLLIAAHLHVTQPTVVAQLRPTYQPVAVLHQTYLPVATLHEPVLTTVPLDPPAAKPQPTKCHWLAPLKPQYQLCSNGTTISQ